MKKLTIAALIASQILAVAPPATAAPLDDRVEITEQRRGAFAGARVRVPFGGAQAGQPRASLALTSVGHSQSADGRVRTRFAEGIELGLSPERPLTLSVGGAPFAERLAAAQGNERRRRPRDLEQERRTGTAILKGAAVVAIVGAAVVGGLFLLIAIGCDGNRCDE